MPQVISGERKMPCLVCLMGGFPVHIAQCKYTAGLARAGFEPEKREKENHFLGSNQVGSLI